MIHVFRIIDYPNEFLININCSETQEIKEFLKRYHFNETDLSQWHPPNAFECQYYRYFRYGELNVNLTKEDAERKVQHVINEIKQKIRLPIVKMLIFRGNKFIEQDRQKSVKRKIEDDILRHFSSQSYIFENNVIYSNHDKKKIGAYLIIRGIKFYFSFSLDGHLLVNTTPVIGIQDSSNQILINENNHFLLDLTSLQKSEYKRFITLSTDEMVKFCKRFIETLPRETVLEEYQIDLDVCDSHELGFETWIWAHDMPLRVEVGQEQLFTLAQSLSNKPNIELFKIPSGDWHFFIVQPSVQLNGLTGLTQSIKQKILGVVDKLSNDMIAIQPSFVRVINYDIEQSPQSIVEEARTILGKTEYKAVFLIISPPKNSEQFGSIDVFTGKLGGQLRGINQNDIYTTTLNWLDLSIQSEIEYITGNSILKSITALGATPWRVRKNLLEGEESADNTCYVGIDVNKKYHNDEFPRVGGVIFDGYGVLVGFHVIKQVNKEGDDITKTEMRELIEKLLSYYEDVLGYQPKHIVIHRDGYIRNENELDIAELLKQRGLKVDFLEILKGNHETTRLCQEGNLELTPSRDIALGNIRTKEAYLMTTLVIRESEKYPAPVPITIRHRYGDTPLKTLAGQVYALTHANYNNYHRTNRLPITIFYADALVDNIRMKGSEGCPIFVGDKIFWL